MKLKKGVVAICLLLLTLPAMAAPNSAHRLSAQIPLDSWTYPALERVVALCWVTSALAGTRPLTRLEAARLVGEASRKAERYKLEPQVRVLLQRLEREFAAELNYLKNEAGGTTAVPSRLLRNMELRAVYRDGGDSSSPGTDARQFALNVNDFGRDYDQHANLEWQLDTELRLFDRLLLTWSPYVGYYEDDGAELGTLAAVAAVSFGGIELSAGRQSLWWGPGRNGSLLLTNNAEPLDMVRLTNPSPVQLPWVLKYLGPFRFDLFVSQLDDDRVVPEPYFGGARINFKPSRYLELGATRTVMFGGDGRPDVDFKDFLTIVGGENLAGSEDTSNSIAGVDARLIFPLLWGMEVYGELAGEDEAAALGVFPWFSKNSFMAGLYLPQIEPTGRFSLRIEYADTSRIGGGNPVFYRHGIYQSGYIYEGRIIGHYVGSDARDLSVKLRSDSSETLSWALGFDYQSRGDVLPVQEDHYQGSLDIDYRLSPNLTLSALYAFDRVKHFQFGDDDEYLHFGKVGVSYQW